MEVLYARCAGLDVHQKSVVACARTVADGKVSRTVRTFGTTTRDLGDLASWLDEQGVTHVVMESTGVYWKPVWHILDDGDLELVLANARDVKNVAAWFTSRGVDTKTDSVIERLLYEAGLL